MKRIIFEIEEWNELKSKLHNETTIKGKLEINKEKLMEAAKDPESFNKFIDELIEDTYRDAERQVVCKWLKDKIREVKK